MGAGGSPRTRRDCRRRSMSFLHRPNIPMPILIRIITAILLIILIILIWAIEPWFFGLGPTIVVAQRFPHFHHGFVHGFHGGFVHGFHGGFSHGFHGGFHGGLGGHGGGRGGGHR